MPGLYCPSSWTPLPLTDSCVRAYAKGPCLSLRARLTYHNPQPQPVDGVFVYPLAEAEVVSGFEAEAAGRRVSFQLQRRRSQATCCRALGPGLGTTTPRRCSQGHLVLDVAQAQSTLVLPTGLVAAAGTMTVTLCSSWELPSRPDGVMHVALPTVFTPLAQPGLPGTPRSPGLCDDRLGLCPTSCFGVGSPEEEGLTWEQPSAPPDVFSGPAHCPAPYTFSFEMLVTGPCLLAGLESPSHALRADALPHASSAATICVTLAEGHRCDRALEILLHPSEPHQPHLMLEAGSLSSAEYEARVRARHDFQRLQRRDSDGERQVWFLQRRFHKDILLNPVLVLSFCPDLSSKPGHLSAATRELFFLLDGSCAVHKDAIVLAVKSLPAQTLVNLATFGTSVQPLFPESQPCSDGTVQRICESIETLQAVSGPPDVLAVLNWALGQPQHRAHPRQLFLITAASPGAATTHRALEFMRWHRGTARCFSFALAPACHQLLRSLSVLSRGQAHFLRPGERLQPKLVQALRKALEPALSDVSVDWFVPDAVEALLTPREIPALYPGDQLLGYCSLFRVDGFRSRAPGGQEPGWQSLGGSVFPSPEEALSVTSPGTEPTHTTEPLRTGTVSAELSSPWGVGDSEQGMEALTDPGTGPGPNPSADTAIWRRIFQSSYIREQYVLTHCSASPEPGPGSTCSSESPGSQGPGSPNGSLPLDPPSQQGCRSLAWVEPAASRSCPLPVPPPAPFKVGALSAEVLGRRHRAALAGRSLSSPSGRTNPVPGRPRHPSLDAIPDGTGPEPGQQLGQGLDDSGNLLSPAPLDWDMLMEPSFLFKAVPANGESAPPAEPLPPQAPRCHVVIRALCGEQPMCWEVGIGLEELWDPGDGSQPASVPVREAAWDQALHRLTAASVVRDNEQLALRGRGEATSEQGRVKRSWLRAVQTSKASSAPSHFTCPVAVDASTREVLPGGLQVWSSDPAELSGVSASQDHLVTAPLPTAAHSKGHQGGSSAGAWNRNLNDNSKSALGEPISPTAGHHGLPRQPSATSRLSLSRHRRLCSSSKGQASESDSDGSNHDYLPLVRLQEAPGSFRLDEPFCAAVCIPQERLCRASPFAAHRASLSPTSASSPWALLGPGIGHGDSATASCSPSPSSGSEGPGQVDSGRGSDTEVSEGMERQGSSDLRGRTWATAVALAWLEHRCAAAFGEWELTASKADCWLRAQHLPDGLDLTALKAAARGLFLLLRHWDQNLQLHLLCYSPANV
ncbi:von Willebrand factor A domain-containing protein 5B2 isoform X1 [Mesocricetus auratus]|uniref:von Willebrand factor A domain-containing protein 5B2 isoform X1 n=2 Tax=Mesocricetus auratus TaxID=10036 RepID=A0A3Q0CT62_MESAU|nr:von Willebrand factor A domain-containing protein 5B2 isoform X1 [Mesocricetus auratus]XP_021083788.2 von Willebrand factor A domain-containing protein 5B2 isoform X1 [Mesocricetus auratus]XP_040607005.1 von Willebrand factor A domain-containing protein 5B2 isoform X1 [Mesocricetus auratus]XP_040607006.1 von Willebrand factor A domain-containing protein 5B2 isoform X1 [Mesocricetus auratus]XP_040607007.1 von Willebrand factor A domain-containing protein 5B2 isoform X1 [Mesocricetus auratus]